MEPNYGAIFKNKLKDNPKAPDYFGKVTIEGKEYKISGWKKESKKGGETYISIAVQSPQQNYRTKSTTQSKYQEPDPTYYDNHDPL